MLFQKKSMGLGKRGMALEKRAWCRAMLKLARGKATSMSDLHEHTA